MVRVTFLLEKCNLAGLSYIFGALNVTLTAGVTFSGFLNVTLPAESYI